KHELYFRMFSKKCFDVAVVPDINDSNGSGGSRSDGSFTLPLEQHIPGASPGHLNASQYE
ncbi:unnamed protein product, partial [Rotaria magnacalcarata]